MKRALIIAAALLVPTTASAEPVYMACEFESPSTAYPIDVSADETSGIVTVSVPKTGSNQRFRAFFSKDKVIFQDEQSQYTLSRVTLGMMRVTPIIKQVDIAWCKLEAKPKRAF